MNTSIIKKYITPKNVLDIGAHTGEFYAEIKHYFPNCNCLLIEGNPDCEPYLKALNVPYHICLLGSENKKVNFYKNKKNTVCTGSSMFRELSEHYNDENLFITTLECHRLDDLNKNNVYFDLVKIDTQGAEIDIFKGGIKTFAKAKAIIMETSIKPYNAGAPLQDEVIKYMDSHGFKNVEIIGENRENGGQGDVMQQDILFINTESVL